MEEDIKLLQEALKATQTELARAKVVMASMIVCLQDSIGHQNSRDLIAELDT